MAQQRESTDKLEKLMNRLLTGASQEEIRKLQKQYDELEVRVTAEEANKMSRLLHSVVSAENIEKCSRR